MGGAQPVADSFQNGQDSELSALEKEPSKWDCTVPWETPRWSGVDIRDAHRAGKECFVCFPCADGNFQQQVNRGVPCSVMLLTSCTPCPLSGPHSTPSQAWFSYSPGVVQG